MADHDGMFPRRAAWACVVTVVGLLLLFSFKTPGMGVTQAANGATGDQAIVSDAGPTATSGATGDTRATGSSGSTDTTGSSDASGSTGSATDSGTSGSNGSTGSSSSSSNGSSGSSSSTSTTTAYRDGTYTGDTITTRYGEVQVKVTVSGGAITDVAALSLPDRDGHSSRISSQAGPILRDEALTAQSAQIDLLSGATYTSDGYERSLQSALDQAAA